MTFAALVGAACSSKDSGGDADSVSPCDPAMEDAFAAWGQAGFSGSIAISSGGEFGCLAAYGVADRAADTPNTVDTVFSIGSVTKAFTAAAVLDLIDQGKLSLDARAGDVVDGLGGPAADATVQQLLLHTSGLTGSHGQDYVPLVREAAVVAISGLDLVFEPGSDFLYSNSGYTLLALIVEEASGTTPTAQASACRSPTRSRWPTVARSRSPRLAPPATAPSSASVYVADRRAHAGRTLPQC